jgi:deoxyadenosine/deoxycytidine kinase
MSIKGWHMMGKLITVVGNSGVGKTTFAKQLCAAAHYSHGLEQHIERPFHLLFAEDKHTYALPNQIDFLLFRAEQELAIRNSAINGVQDGGLDQDFFVFTKLFYHKGYLNQKEYALCQRVYQLLRQILPHPDLVIWLQAPVEVIAERYRARGRVLRIAKMEDLEEMRILLQEWLGEMPLSRLLTIDVENEEQSYSTSIEEVLHRIDLLE